MRQLLASVSIILLMAVGSSTAATIMGRLLDSETNGLIRDVNIHVLVTDKTVSSDKHGRFQITGLEDLVYTLVVTHVSYDTDTIEIDASLDKTHDIFLNSVPWVLNSVVVTGTRSPHLLKDVPVQTEVVTPRDFKRTGATTVDEALKSSIGINIREDLSGQAATIRGIEGERVLVLVDGERAVGRISGSLDLGQFSLTNVEKIEIVKGTGSTLYGSDAMGGVINIITNKAVRQEKSADIDLDFGVGGDSQRFPYFILNNTSRSGTGPNNFNQSYNSSGSFRYGNGSTGLTVGARLFATEGFDLNKKTPHTNGEEEIKRVNFDTKFRRKLTEKWSVTLSNRFMRERRDWVESELFPPNLVFVYDDVEINKRYESSVNLDYLSGDKYSMNFRLFATYYDHDWNKYAAAERTWLDTSQTEDLFVEAAYSANYVIGQNHVATYGADYYLQDLHSSELVDASKANRAGDAYLQYEYSPFRAVTFVTGVRWEENSSFGRHINPSFNVMYSASSEIKFRGFVGRGYRSPSIKQQYFVFDHTAAGYIVYGGAVPLPEEVLRQVDQDSYSELVQETSINSSISMELSYGTIGLHRLTYFYNHIDDLIDFQLIGFPEPYWRGMYVYQNIESAITQGLEWESRTRLSDALDLSFSYNYLFTRNLELSEQLVNRPDHTLKFFVTGFNKGSGYGGSVWGEYVSRKLWVPRSNTGGNEGEPQFAPHRTTLNASLFKRIGKGTELSVRWENILNETNIEYGYWPGFELFVGIKHDFDWSNE
ncbi:MAG: TonB-dependent receptor [bacterium]|nr:TonB-dependent receptor [bacterium]